MGMNMTVQTANILSVFLSWLQLLSAEELQDLHSESEVESRGQQVYPVCPERTVGWEASRRRANWGFSTAHHHTLLHTPITHPPTGTLQSAGSLFSFSASLCVSLVLRGSLVTCHEVVLPHGGTKSQDYNVADVSIRNTQSKAVMSIRDW